MYLQSILSWSGDDDAAYATASEGLARAEEAGDVLGEIGSLIARSATYRGELDVGLEHAERALFSAFSSSNRR